MMKNDHVAAVDARWNDHNVVLLNELDNIGFNQEDKEFIIDLLDCDVFYSIDDPNISKLLYDSDDFIYWKRPGLITFNVYPNTVHQTCLEILYAIEIACKKGITDFLDAQDVANSLIPKNISIFGYLAEQFVEEGFGFYKSSQHNRITKSDDYKMNFREKQIFKRYC